MTSAVRTSAGLAAPARHAQALPFAVLLALLAGAYTVWLLAFWPGVLGEDSRALLKEIESPDTFFSGKPVLWYWFVKLLFGVASRVEVPIAAMLCFSALVLARILAWCWSYGLRKTAVAGLLLIALAPHTMFFIGSLYADGVYAVAVTGLLFELWLCARTRQARPASLLVIAMTLPFAAFFRPNGILFLVPVAVLAWWVGRAERRWLALILLAWCAVAVAGARLHKVPRHESLFPLVMWETVNFLQPRAMQLWTAAPRVSQTTLDAMARHRPLHNYVSHYDPDYWDPLNYHAAGPHVMAMAKADRKVVVREFFRHNLWQNMPKFIGSRVNVFFVAALAQGGFPAHAYAQKILADTPTRSTYRAFGLDRAETMLLGLYEFSFAHRHLLWTPFLGMLLVVVALYRGLKSRDGPLLLVAVPMAMQVGAIASFSVAGEYRYLFPFFMLPLVLVPAMVVRTGRSAAD